VIITEERVREKKGGKIDEKTKYVA